MIIVFIVLSVCAILAAFRQTRPEWPMPLSYHIIINESMALLATLAYGIFVHFVIAIISRRKKWISKNFAATAFATVDTLTASDYVGIVSGKTHPDKIRNTGWNTVKAENVDAPVFNCFPMTMECRIKEKLYESESGYYIIAEIINIVCDEKYLAKDGKPDVEKMRLITFDPIHNAYIALGDKVGNAFSDGNALK